jgi:Tfp pilus assembly major pilin PilA
MDRPSINGFTIIEIFFAILIVSISAIVITFFTRNSIGSYLNAHMTETAYVCGEEKLSELKAMPLPANGNDSKVIDNDAFTRTWTINNVNNVQTATVRVDWAMMNRNRTIRVYGVLK